MYLVIGSTGRVGTAAVDTLLADGEPVRVLVRSAVQATPFMAKGCDVAIGDVLDRSSLDAALAGISGVVNCIGAPRRRRTGRSTILRIEIDGNRHLIDAARASSLRPHIVYVSAFNLEKAQYVPFFFAKMKTEAALSGSGLPYTILRPSTFMEALMEFVRNGVATLPGRLANPTSPVAAHDVGRAAVRCFGRQDASGATYPLFGPQKMSYDEFIEDWVAVTGKPVKIRRVPLAAFRLASAAGSPIAPYLPVLYSLVRSVNELDYSGAPGVLEDLIGRPATTVKQHIARVIASRVGVAATADRLADP